MGYIIKRALPTGDWFLKKNGAWSDCRTEARKYDHSEANGILSCLPPMYDATICKV